MTHAVDAVVAGTNRNAFCAVRPPGHHAGTNGLLEAAVSWLVDMWLVGGLMLVGWLVFRLVGWCFGWCVVV